VGFKVCEKQLSEAHYYGEIRHFFSIIRQRIAAKLLLKPHLDIHSADSRHYSQPRLKKYVFSIVKTG